MTSGYVVTVTPAGDVLPGDVWEWSQGYGGGEKTVRGVERYDGAPGYVVFDDGMSAPLAAMTREGGIWTLTSREPVSRQEVDTLEEMLERVADLCIERFGGEPGPAYAAAGWPGAQEIVALHDQRGGSLKLPNGESISVERVEDDGEGR